MFIVPFKLCFSVAICTCVYYHMKKLQVNFLFHLQFCFIRNTPKSSNGHQLQEYLTLDTCVEMFYG